jgi:hypothetical protein
MKLTLQILTYLIFAIGCSAATNDLESDKTINKIFNKDEVKDLETLVNFFENQICLGQNIDTPNKQDCYESFFKHMVQCEKTGEIILNISFEEQKKMYNQIRKKTFNEIWGLGWQTWNNNGEKLKLYGLQTKGKFVEFLHELSLDYPIIDHYYNTFIMAGDIAPSMVANIIMRHEELDTSDIRIRLMLAIHYLTMNDRYERKEKY